MAQIGQGLGQQLCLFELEGRFDATLQSVLESNEGLFVPDAARLQQQGILVVLDVRHDALRRQAVTIVGSVGRTALLPFPPTRARIDEKTVFVRLPTPTQSLVDTSDGGTGTVAQSANVALTVPGQHGVDIDASITNRPAEGGLQLESLALSFFVVGGDALGGFGIDVVNTVQTVDLQSIQ
ncbi:hypothetical protein AQ946_05650 [Burkholderia pseudomallei]|nr:hypothetical protein AQ766_27345 [Burkholderia pseudomallei]ONE15044.1 hypothetical protein AQ946_05650 [Burkholderia pseudomallei]ONE40762.1 hypothetical protein AQ948_12560 [Burkholderia pseudomallei]ONE41896.1 hypothetical protein AQ947_09965 [Burkholderia pseudomallei]